MHKSLIEFSNLELYEILQRNESTDLKELSAYCSEIIRRMLDDKIKKLHLIYILQKSFDDALSICDPIEFQRRHQKLLYSIADVLLSELEETMPET